MKNGTFAIYMGKEYEVGYKDDYLILYSDDPEKEKGFRPVETCTHYIKYVKHEDVDELYKLDTMARYKGYDAEVMEEKEDKILILIDNITAKTSEELGMDRAYDNGMYLKWINKDEADIRVEKTPR